MVTGRGPRRGLEGQGARRPISWRWTRSPTSDFIQGDFTSDTVLEQIRAWLQGEKFDLIVSGYRPNLSGIDSADQARSIHFLELALDTVKQALKPGATFVAKCSRDRVRTSNQGAAYLLPQGLDPQAERPPDPSRARSISSRSPG
jgi:23S rRNA (uridine2552-2'-O)-methyltransferase